MSKVGAPVFTREPVLKGRVTYTQGAAVVKRLDLSQPLYAAFGAEAPVLEMEMAYLIANTLQAATGRPVRISSTEDLPPAALSSGTLLLVGTARSNPLIKAATEPTAPGHGVVKLEAGTGQQRWIFTGVDPRAVQAAATDFVLRYWQNAQHAAIRITGKEPGAALGHRVGANQPDPH